MGEYPALSDQDIVAIRRLIFQSRLSLQDVVVTTERPVTTT